MKQKILLGAALLGAVAYAGTSLSNSVPEIVQRAEPEASIRVTVTTPQEKRVVERAGVTGSLVPREEITVFAEISSARILSLSAEVGDVVRKGDTLAVLDTEGVRLQVTQMEAEYAKARDEFARVNSIKDTGAVSKSLVTEKKNAMDATKARLEEARLALRRTVIIAPENGVIFERRATIGGLANTSEALFRIARDGEIEAELRVPEEVASRVLPAAAVSLSVSGIPEPLTGSVRLVSPRIDATDRSAPVRVAIAAGAGLKFGSYVHGDIALDAVTALAVPATSVQRDAAGAFVWTVEAEGRITRQPITLRLHQNDVALVTGVTAQQRIVVRAGSLIGLGDVVTTIEVR
ncbi:efflux RND transporter periplasmic adaptor subunit [Rhodospirillaceae bacterium KN72]|uniref:Efflux RND transporter periplasmic adaptor subunit n=1 Tax=Pacificispira spongiicola TaxID=2729598 RepID=A0A7Y0DXW2_9PROT|nr:efflux RND transporter periplasmic adaptor subunit [Pacificispira spongiicola]NMM43619.1 efflux RND transporter periplasmic adaptor subunit [Pacificispira spongiicola]